jgi:hypothetical protein
VAAKAGNGTVIDAGIPREESVHLMSTHYRFS